MAIASMLESSDPDQAQANAIGALTLAATELKRTRIKLQVPFSAVTLCYSTYDEHVSLRYSDPAAQLLVSGAVEPSMIEAAPQRRRIHNRRDSQLREMCSGTSVT